jgi:hypothetical protein
VLGEAGEWLHHQHSGHDDGLARPSLSLSR